MDEIDGEKIDHLESLNRKDIEYSWMNRYALPWETLLENSAGELVHDSACTNKFIGGVDQFNSYTNLYEKSNHQTATPNPNNNLLRCVMIILDGSEAMLNMELRPSRFFCSVKVVMDFVKKFFQRNPISQLGLSIMYSSGTKLLCSFQNGSSKLLEVLEELISSSKSTTNTISGATISLQNALSFSLERFQHISDGATKEVLFICASLTTIDPSDVYSSLDLLTQNEIIVSAVHLAAEFYLLKEIVQKTHGVFNVMLDESHFINCMNAHLQCQTSVERMPLNKVRPSYGKLIKLGFPNTNQNNSQFNTTLNVLCSCHKSEIYDEKLPGFTTKHGYFCPICYTKYCNLPTKCDRCSLLLVEAPYLTRSYLLCHSLGDKLSNIVPLEIGNDPLKCHFCSVNISNENADFTTTLTLNQCTSCKLFMCGGCKDYVKNSLGFCPGCVV